MILHLCPAFVHSGVIPVATDAGLHRIRKKRCKKHPERPGFPPGWTRIASHILEIELPGVIFIGRMQILHHSYILHAYSVYTLFIFYTSSVHSRSLSFELTVSASRSRRSTAALCGMGNGRSRSAGAPGAEQQPCFVKSRESLCWNSEARCAKAAGLLCNK